MGDTSVGSSRGHGWREVAVQILIRVVAALIVAAGGFLFGLATGRNKERELYARTVQDAPNAFADRIGELIAQAEISGIDDVRVTGQALVSARNDLRSSLTNLSRLLNSDIDRLEALVSDLDSLRLRDAPCKGSGSRASTRTRASSGTFC
jgi:hypothetical protein